MSPLLVPRRLDSKLAELARTFPAVLVVGPRAVGKTTSARSLARTIVRLDRDADAVLYRADPDAALATDEEPILLDEWQAVPEVLGAVKRAIDDDHRSGRFILTGSVRADLDSQTWPGTGRIIRVPMHGLTVGEILRRPAAGADILDALRAGAAGDVPLPADVPDVVGYVQWAARGSFPVPALSDDETFRRRWLESYLDQLVTRDLATVGERRDPARMRRYLRAVMLHSGSVVSARTIDSSADITAKTGADYGRLLSDLFIAETVPAWHSRRITRLVKAGKTYALDPALAIVATGMSAKSVLRDPAMLGRVIDTFVAAQLRPIIAASDNPATLHHLRQEDGRREIDLVLEFVDGSVVAIETKAAAVVSDADARHLIWLRDQIGDQFAGGAVLYTGRRPYRVAERILAVPIAALWG